MSDKEKSNSQGDYTVNNVINLSLLRRINSSDNVRRNDNILCSCQILDFIIQIKVHE